MSARLHIAADAIVRVQDGELLMHTTASNLPAFRTDNPLLLGWVLQFARPSDPDVLCAQLPDADRVPARRVLDYLQRAGVLEQAEATADPANDAFLHERSTQHLRLLARSAYDLACDVHGLGPDAEQALKRRSGVGLERRLLGLLAAMDDLRAQLRAMRAATMPERLAAAGVDPLDRKLRIHVGCGKASLHGWVNIDVHPAPLSLNVLAGLPFATASATHVFVSHLLEHLHFPRDVRQFLGELRRVLVPGGRVRLVVPDVEQCIEAYTKDDRLFYAGRRETWPWWPENPTRLEDFLAYAGVGPEPAHTFESHKYGYDYETLERVLADCGFVGVVRSAYMRSDDPELRVDDVSEVAGARYGERYYSLFVEAVAPGQRCVSAPPKR